MVVAVVPMLVLQELVQVLLVQRLDRLSGHRVEQVLAWSGHRHIRHLVLLPDTELVLWDKDRPSIDQLQDQVRPLVVN